MAYNNSGELPIGQSYQLGDYVFSITVSHDPGESETGINVRCDKGGERARVASEVTGTVESWSVEANETEASVYVKYKTPSGKLVSASLPIVSTAGTYLGKAGNRTYYKTNDGDAVAWFDSVGTGGPELLSNVSSAVAFTGTPPGVATYTVDGVTWYLSYGYHDYGPFDTAGLPDLGEGWDGWSQQQFEDFLQQYGIRVESEAEEQLVARFAIDIREAGGGPGGGWDEPGDTGDPSYTLNVNVTGASAGTHDAASAPMAPADQPVYGSGGAGGNGGGGGAGQSTVIVRRFATDKAGSVNQEVTLRPPGVGSKGGPGGKGGDGCILIFY